MTERGASPRCHCEAPAEERGTKQSRSGLLRCARNDTGQCVSFTVRLNLPRHRMQPNDVYPIASATMASAAFSPIMYTAEAMK
jgi:hypothetical protein